MTRRLRHAIQLGAPLVLLLAACSGNTAPASPTPTSVAVSPEVTDAATVSLEPTEAPTDEPTDEPTEAPTDEPTDEPTEAPTDEPTEAPTDTPSAAPTDSVEPGPTGPEPTELPSFTADPELEALLPTEVGGETLNVLSFSGEDLQNLPQGQDPATAEFFERMNAEPEDVSFAYATTGILSDVVVNVIAFQIDGADSDQLIGTYIEAAEETTTAGLDTEAATVAGKDVVFVTNNDAPPPFNTFYLYGYEDVLFFVQTTDDAAAEEAISLLP